MPLILHIETAVEGASICLSQEENILVTAENPDQRDSAAWLHSAMQGLMLQAGKAWSDLSAVAVSNGPGSYTGLRVGLSAAKGICYAADLPLITIGTLQIMAAAAGPQNGLLCPMIDARRMEVFTAIFDEAGNEIQPVQNLVLTPESFGDLLTRQKIFFFGNGSKKFSEIVAHTNAVFMDVRFSAVDMVQLSIKKFEERRFEDVAYSEPQYGKAFYSTQKKL